MYFAKSYFSKSTHQTTEHSGAMQIEMFSHGNMQQWKLYSESKNNSDSTYATIISYQKRYAMLFNLVDKWINGADPANVVLLYNC